MYLNHFGFKQFPFALTPSLQFFCNLESYREALDVIMVSLSNGEGFVKITGEIGTGKTLLCRKLLDSLDDKYISAYILNPTLDCFNLQKAIVRELGISFPDNIDQHSLLNLFTNKLIELHQANKRVIIIIDEAQVLSDDALEGLRLLSNLETESSKLIQIVLFGQPELEKRLQQPQLRQLKQRIVFSYHLNTLQPNELSAYLHFRLATAGFISTYDALFSSKAIKLLFKASRGIPRLINILCHKALLISYGYNKNRIDTREMQLAIQDTDSSVTTYQRLYNIALNGALLVSVSLLAICGYFALRLLNL